MNVAGRAREIPLFPLNTVLFPEGLLPLKVFEQRYLEMTKACLRDGAPFDARNATRVRWLGVLLIAGELSLKALTFWLSSIVLRTLAAGPQALGPSFTVDAKVILIGLMLVALAEVFRRGTTLEDEQSLVV